MEISTKLFIDKNMFIIRNNNIKLIEIFLVGHEIIDYNKFTYLLLIDIASLYYLFYPY